MASCAENAIRCAQLSPITAKLTLRQVEVFELILKGYCNKEIAANLNIELRTVKLLSSASTVLSESQTAGNSSASSAASR